MARKVFLLFDIDGTLLHSGGAGRRALLRAAQLIGLTPASLVNYSFAGLTDRQIFRDMLAHPTSPRDDGGLLASLEAAYLQCLADMLAAENTVRVYPHVKELLQAIGSRPEYEAALLTGNLPQGAQLKLAAAGLDGFFRWGVFGDHSADRNELARQAWNQVVARQPDVRPDEVMVIGDTSRDVACGRAIDAVTVAVATGFETEETLHAAAPDHLLADFSGLFPLLGLASA